MQKKYFAMMVVEVQVASLSGWQNEKNFRIGRRRLDGVNHVPIRNRKQMTRRLRSFPIIEKSFVDKQLETVSFISAER